jgi:hypothetical protein
VIDIPNIVSPLPVVDHYGVRARAASPFPTFSHRIFAPRTLIRRLHPLVSLSVEVIGESGAFTVPVRATSIRRAAELVASSFPGSEVCVIFPIDGDGFFTDDGDVEELGAAPLTPVAG